MEKYTDREILENKIEAINALGLFMNRAIPMYQKYLDEGFKINKGNVFSKKDKKALRVLEKDIMESLPFSVTSKVHHYLQITDYSIIINFDTHFRVSEVSVNYYKEYHYIYDRTSGDIYNYEPRRTDYTLEEINKGRQDIAAIQEEINALERKMDEVAKPIYPFIAK